MIRLACLDMAGTTVADGGTVEAAFGVAVAELGVDPGTRAHDDALALVRETMGESKIVVFRRVFGGDEAKAAAANQAFEAAYERSVERGEIGALPGALDTMRSLRDGGVAVCLTTGFAGRTQHAILDSLGWWGEIDLAICPADAGRGRPYPDMILAAVLRLEIDAVDEVAVAGDTTSDLVAGTRAGAGIVAGVLTGAHDRTTLETAPHTHVLESVAGLVTLTRPA